MQQNKDSKYPPKYHNLDFYLNSLKDPTYRLNISSYHLNKRGDYKFLQQKHAYIQWLFPNHYPSKFNYNSYPLNEHQALHFRSNPIIAKNIIFSYELIMDFMGIKLKCVRTGELALLSQKRLQNVLLKYTHNHLRLMRIIACLSTVGFRGYGKKLIGFLDGVTGKQKFAGARGVFMGRWKVYEDDEKAKDMCFLKDVEMLNQRSCIFEDEEQMERIQRRVEQLQDQKQTKK